MAIAVALIIGTVTSGLVYFAIVRGGVHGPTARRSPSPGLGPVTADSRLLAGAGGLVFADNFADPSSGWSSGTAASGTTFRYSNGTYVVVGKGTLHHLLFAPYSRQLDQLSMEASATQTGGAPNGAGFGVFCDTGSGSAELAYELLVLQPGTWYVERSDGRVSPTNEVSIIKQGSSPEAPGVTPLTVTGMCATLADGHTTRLALFVDGNLVADVTDFTSATLSGWVGGVVTASRETQSTTVTFTQFKERNLSGGG